MWGQSFFSKKNRSLEADGQLMDEYHVLTVPSVADEACRSISHRVQKSLNKSALFISNSGETIVVGRVDLIGNVLHANHDFARELDLGNTSGNPRAIRFGHSYYSSSANGVRIPDHIELITKQKVDLEAILAKAHEGLEPIIMPAAEFRMGRQAGSDWDRIAHEVEAGKCNGGLFHMDGTIIERFEAIAERVSEEAQKKTAQKMARPNTPVVLPKRRTPRFMTIAAVSAGVAITGWIAWHLLQQQASNEAMQARLKSR